MTNEELKSCRATLGLDQRQMAARLRTPYGTYRGWETGRRPIPGIVDAALNALDRLDDLSHRYDQDCRE